MGAFLGNSKGLAFGWVKLHLVGFFPELEGVKVFLELGGVVRGVDGPVMETVICKKSYVGLRR